MKTLWYFYLLFLSKIFYNVIRFLKISDGTALIGLIVLKFDKNFLKQSSKYIDRIITVTGTNGKTTTSGLISHILEKNNYKVLSNTEGANMVTGIANAFAVKLNPFRNSDFAVLESDEAYLTKLYDELNADYLVVTNLFRDQLDRYGELNTTAKKIQNAIDKNPNLKLILNADDPMVATLNSKNENIYYGINKIEYCFDEPESKSPKDLINCPVCKKELEYSERFYAQEGHYYCSCGYKRPNCKYNADVLIYENYSLINLSVNDKIYEIKTKLTGLYNAYNVLASVVLCFELGITDFQNTLDDYIPEFGRNEIRNINGKEVLIQLIKNPTGASEVLRTINSESDVLIAINDDYADGRDVSWLWDSDFEELQKCGKNIIVTGKRAKDMAVRLKYAEVKNFTVILDIDKAIKYITQKADDKVTILTTYTALLHINRHK